MNASAIQTSQSQPSASHFGVASVKPNTAGANQSSTTYSPGGRFSAQFQTVDRLIINAYRIRDYQLSGLPSWASSERYDIEARAAGTPSRDDMRSMVQRLLAERFQLKLHHESKEFAVYDLVTGKSGPKLKRAEDRPANGIAPRGGHLDGYGASMGELADQLSRILGRPVFDKTGMAGSFDFKLDYAAVEVQRDPNSVPAAAAADIFAAIQEQLGLRLEASKALIDVLIVDKIEKPTEN
jgi:uncharacterized protein (TIGR03435 family)